MNTMYIPSYDLEQDATENLNFRVAPQMKEDVKAAAHKINLSMAQWCRKALLFALQNMDESDIEQELDAKIRAIVDEMFEQKISSLRAVAETSKAYKKD